MYPNKAELKQPKGYIMSTKERECKIHELELFKIKVNLNVLKQFTRKMCIYTEKNLKKSKL